MDEKIIITGLTGQLGWEPSEVLIKKYGENSVIALDISEISEFGCDFDTLDAYDTVGINRIVIAYRITQIYHLAVFLSAKGKQIPLNTWNIYRKILYNVLECAKDNKLNKVFIPCFIAEYGNSVPKINTPQNALLNPSTANEMSKASGEHWPQYYLTKYGLSVQSLRYTEIVGHQSIPGGGITDYAVEIYHIAVKEESFVCYLNEEARFPMIYMDDAIRATLDLMESPKENLVLKSSYNLQGISFAPNEIENSIKKYYPNFKVFYKTIFRQEIADTWPQSLDDTEERKEWDWTPRYSLMDMTRAMIT